MLTKRIILCPDVKGGRGVKGESFFRLRDAGDTIDLAGFYSQKGADGLFSLDISTTPEGSDTWQYLTKQGIPIRMQRG